MKNPVLDSEALHLVGEFLQVYGPTGSSEVAWNPLSGVGTRAATWLETTFAPLPVRIFSKYILVYLGSIVAFLPPAGCRNFP